MESVHQEDLIILNMCAYNIRASTHMHQHLLKLQRIDTITFIEEIEWNFNGMYRIPCELRTILWLISEKCSYILIFWGCHNRGPQMDGLKEEEVIASCSGDYRAKVLSESWSLKPLRENLYLLLVSNGGPQSWLSWACSCIISVSTSVITWHYPCMFVFPLIRTLVVTDWGSSFSIMTSS